MSKKPAALKKIKKQLQANAVNVESQHRNNKLASWVELGVAVALTFLLIILHFTIFLNSGGLWRDEVNSVNISNLASISDIWEKLQFDSFPILWLLLLRIWSLIGFGESDFALRAFGLIIGLGTLGILWYTARAFSMRVPMISLVLFAMSPTTFVGDSLRAYGLGVLLIILNLAAMWRVIQNPIPRHMFVSAIVAVLSVQCLYHNSFLVLAICMGAFAVWFSHRDWKLMLFPLGAGMLALASVLPYLGTISRKGNWNIIFRAPIDLSWIFDKLRQAIDPYGTLLMLIWLTLSLILIVSLIRILVKSASDTSMKQKDLAIFLLATFMLSIIAYIVFIKILAYPTQSWYYLPLLAILIIILEKGIDVICRSSLPARIIRIVFVLGITAFTFVNSWEAAHIRKTNMDLLTAKLESLSDKNDFIIVYPSYYGVSFARYYKGTTPWMTLPDLSDHSTHRYDIFKAKMMQKEPIEPILQKIVKTLQNKHQIWLVGVLDFLDPGTNPYQLPPAPYSPYGWLDGAYQTAWSQQAAFTLQTHGQILKEITIPTVNQVNKFENVPLLVVQGWHP